MAFFPCDVGPHINRSGRNVSVYLGELHDNGSTRTKFRLCSGHFSEVQAGLCQFEVDPESGAVSDATRDGLCLICLKPCDEVTRQLFFTCYPPNNERKDYWARIHDTCTLQDWVINPGMGH